MKRLIQELVWPRSVACAALLCSTGRAEIPLQPYPIAWSNTPLSAIDLSKFLDAPAGKDGHLRVQGDRIVKPDGSRFRFWGVNLTGPDCFPEKDLAPAIAGDLARLGINIVRFHHMEATWGGRNIFDPDRDDTRRLSPSSLERLDFFIAELKKRGIYVNLNLNVSRRYKEGDGVRDWEILGYGKSATYFNPRLIELQHEYARQLLTHDNPYTGEDYRHDPCVAVVEMVNENSVLEGWVNWRLVGEDSPKPGTWSPIPASYAAELTDQYNAWLKTNLPSAVLNALRLKYGSGPDGAVPRLRPDQFAQATDIRFHAEARFYLHLEQIFFSGMKKLLKDELGVKAMLVGTADHNDGFAGYAHIQPNLIFDIVDGHGYWEHPRLGGETWIKNTPMVNDPLDATVTQFARTPVLGRPFTISEVNHPFPHEYACEGFPILTAYALFHDWDGLYWFTWGKGRLEDPQAGIRRNGWFDFSNDPSKLATLQACALVWHRHDLLPAKKTVVRSYSLNEMIEALRMDKAKERPFFTPGFTRSTPLQHKTVFTLDQQKATPFPSAAPLGGIIADTGQLGWYDADQQRGLVAVNTDRTQALIGFLRDSTRATKHLAAQVDNAFCTLLLTSVDGRSLANASRILLLATARGIANTGQAWKEDRQTLAQWGHGPVLIEPVTGSITLRNLAPAKNLRAVPLQASGQPMKSHAPAERAGADWKLALGDPATVWYLLEIER